MATTTILQQILSLINNGSTLEQAVEATIPGADADYWRKRIKREQSGQQPPKKSPKKSSSRPSRRRTLRTSVPFVPSSAERQAQRTGRATAELTRRVNEAADSETSAILLNICGQFRILEVR